MSKNQASTLFIDYSETPNREALLLHDHSIVSPDAKIDLKQPQALGHKIYGYLSIGEVAKNAPSRDQALAQGVPVVATNPIWNSSIIDLSDKRWQNFVVDLLAPAIVNKGFDGFFLDTVDTFHYLARKFPARKGQFQQSVVDLVKALRSKYPEKSIIINRGFEVVDRLSSTVDGILVESVFQTYDFDRKAYEAVPAEHTTYLIEKLRQARAHGLTTFVVDYVDPATPQIALDTADRIRNEGSVPFLSTPALNGKCLAPIVKVPRKIFVLFGNDRSDPVFQVKWPADSLTGQCFQMPLEWLGYTLVYCNPALKSVPESLGDDYAGIILDPYLEFPLDQELPLLDWLLQEKSTGKKILILGSIPFAGRPARQSFIKALGMFGTGLPVSLESPPTIKTQTKLTGFEAPLIASEYQYLDLAAPAAANVALGLEGASRDRTIRFDPLFQTDWGGAAFDPYIFFIRPDETRLWIFDPIKFLGSVFTNDAFPVPDVTTRDGTRIFYSHIDGDGFRNFSRVKAGERSAEIVLEQIIKRYPLPITCSVIESEMKGLIALQHEDDADELSRIAKTIFKQENVQAASHTYSHPFYWIDQDQRALGYSAANLSLKGHPDYRMNLSREINGSVDYINKSLLPSNKRVEILLWSGNCRPGVDALRICRELGLLNMNGGDTIISRKHPSLAAVAPSTMRWDDEVQFYSSNQNDNIYYDRLSSNPKPDTKPFLGGYHHIVDTFERTEHPLRVKPVNIYFHFFIADTHESFNTLRRAFDWVMDQNLHAITAAKYLRIVDDTLKTQIYKNGPNAWTIFNTGFQRTFRLPHQGLVPKMNSSAHVTGYRTVGEYLYVHTDGSPRVSLQLTSSPAPHLRLVESSADVRFLELTERRTHFTVRDYRPVRIRFGGLPPQRPVSLKINGVDSLSSADADGGVVLHLPSAAEVVLAGKAL